MATQISFAGNSLQTANIITADIEHTSLPTKDAKLYAVSHANLSKIPFVSYPSKTIKCSGLLTSSSIAGLDAVIDTFKSYFTAQDQNLDIDYNGSTRRYTATVNAINLSRPNNLTYAKFQIDFVCANPFGQDISATTALSAAGRTLGSYSDSYTFLGTAPFQLSVTTITLTAATGLTGATMQWGNGGNGQAISITRTWTAGDVVVIDCNLKTVTVNANPANFTGAFPEFPPGAQTLSYSDSFTTRTFTISAVYTAVYL